MDVKYGSEEARKFVTNLSFITTNGKWGENIMTAEWVHQVSYEPGLVMVNIHDVDATADNILQSKEFGVSVAAFDQAPMVSIAGMSTGKKTDKISILRELGFEFYKAKKIDVQMVKGSALNLECKLVKHEKVGDHIMFIGEVVAAELGTKDPLVFRAATGIFKFGERMEHKKDSEAEKKMATLIEKHRKGY
jgi:flavin reductase (DIM6/NTAB) family NADH-FMN oxidoreductase RutF